MKIPPSFMDGTMEPGRTQEDLFLVPGPLMYKGEVWQVSDHGGAAVSQSGISTMKVEDVESKEGSLHQWEESPERSTSMLPPFGVNQASHLPTPQSPGNLAGYLSGAGTSPLSADPLCAGPSRQFTVSRPPSRPASAHPPKTPQRGSSASASKNRLQSPPSTSQVELGFDYLRQAGKETSPAEPHPSQFATPSPEVLRNRGASVPYTPSDSETVLSTPRAGRRSSSHPYPGQTTLAPTPIISPANSTHSTAYQASPELHRPDVQSGSTYNFSSSMTALVSEENLHATARDRGLYDLVDPFIDRDAGGRDRGLSKERYPSPPRAMRPQHCTIHGNNSPLLQARVTGRKPLENSIAKLVMSPSEFSEAPSNGSPVKTEIEDGEYDVTADARRLPTVDETVFSRAPTSPRTPPRLGPGRGSASVHRTPSLEDSVFRTPPRAAGGEIERIRQRQEELEGARTTEREKHRPEYLVRTKRARDGADDEAAEREREGALPGLGVTVSPIKGRRLKLYQPVPLDDPAVLEESKTKTEETGEPKTPPALTVSSAPAPSWQPNVPTMSLRAIEWRTPGRRQPSPVAWTDEDEIKKQKRLAAFAAPQASGSGRRLKPVEVAGQGRIVIDVTSDETRELAEAGVLAMPELEFPDDSELAAVSGHGAEWPDSEYPWSLQERQRDETEEAERRKRLRWIERFLDRESESEDEDNEGVAGPSTWNQMFDVGALSRPEEGRGKTISLNAIPGSRRPKGARGMAFGAANADAREVLLSKRHVREVAERIRRRKVAEEEEGVVMCICQGADDGRPMVRCDECRTWYHLVCMDIEDESELGEEWYCWKCVPSAEDPPPASLSEPTFAPVMPDSPPRAGVGDLPLYQSALQPSPMLDIRARGPVSPVVQRNRDHSPPRRSRLPHPISGDPDDPVRGGPSTPYHPRSVESRLYSTPKFYDEYGSDDHVPFDPTSTPSRGLTFSNSVPITPRRPQTWTPAQGLSWTTPSGPPRTPQFSSVAGSSSGRSLAYSLSTLEDSAGPLTSPWPEESPVRRPHKSGELTWPYPPPRRALDSPLAVRGAAAPRPFLPGVEESPTARYFHRGKDRDASELTSRAGHGKSPRRE